MASALNWVLRVFMRFSRLRTMLIFAPLLVLSTHLTGQPVAGFSIPSAGCIEENIFATNSSTSSERYVWDFCHKDLQISEPAVSPGVTLPTAGTFYYNAIKLIDDAAAKLAFVTDMNGAKLYRLNYGNDWKSIPSVENLGNFSNLLAGPGALDAIKENGVWYFFVINPFHNSVVRITWGNGLLSTPTDVEGLGNFGGSISTPLGVKAVTSGSSHFVFVANLSAKTITQIDFSTSFANTPSSSKNLSHPSLEPSSIDIISDGTSWYGIAPGFGSTPTVLMDFGPDLNSAPTFTSLSAVPNSRSVKFIKEGETYLAFVRSENNGLYRILFGSDFSVPAGPTRIPINSLQSTSRSLDVIRDAPHWKLFSVEAVTGNVLRADFAGNCDSEVSENYSNAISPLVKYFSAGSYYIQLEAFNENNVSDALGKNINISTSTAPRIEPRIENSCANNPINFFAESEDGNLNGHLWDFGDNSFSNDPSPHHTYSAAGIYHPVLKVTASNGCQNTVKDTIKIYDPPIATFTLPTGIICTNSEFTFNNTTEDTFDGQLSYQWYVENDLVSTARNLDHKFTAAGNHSITLEASIPGCSSEQSQILSGVAAGPIVEFSHSGQCEDEAVRFQSQITDAVTSLKWLINGNEVSNEIDLLHTFNNNGLYEVVLSALSPNGCNNKETKVITIYSKPQANFTVDAPPSSCAGSLTPFNDETPDPADSDLISYLWSFGDAGNNISTLQNPTMVYTSAGNYAVSLYVTSDRGCTDSFEKTITIAQSPSVSISNTPTCVGVPTTFTANGSDLKSYYWEIGTSYSTTQTTNQTFSTPGSRTIYLTVEGMNHCQTTIEKVITVPVKLIPDFSVIKNCVGVDAIFTDLTSGADPVTSRSWNFHSLGSSTQPSPSFSFNSTGSKNITLDIITESGCQYIATKTIQVVDPPVAAFTADPQSGAIPLDVQFTNESTHASSYQWSIDGSPVSSETSPLIPFEEIGEFEVKLTALNAVGCSDEESIVITTATPNPDVDLKLISFSENPDGTYKVIITVHNKGNTILRNLPVDIDVSGNFSLREIIEEPIRPNAMYNLVLSYGIQPQQNLDFLCASTELTGDLSPEGNRICKDFESSISIVPAYPNPANDFLRIEWIAVGGEMVEISLVDNFGKKIWQQSHNSTPGLNEVFWNTSGINDGIYTLRIDAKDQNGLSVRKTQRILVSNQN